MKSKYYHEGHTNAKAIIGFLIVVIVFGILMLFTTYKENLLTSYSLTGFISLTIIGMVLLVALLYLIDRPLWDKQRNISRSSHKKKKR